MDQVPGVGTAEGWIRIRIQAIFLIWSILWIRTVHPVLDTVWMTGSGSPNMDLERIMGNSWWEIHVLFAGRAATCGGAGAGHGAYSQPGAVRDDPHGGAALSRSVILPIRISQFGYPDRGVMRLHKIGTGISWDAVLQPVCLRGDLTSVLRTFWPVFISLGPTKVSLSVGKY